MNREEILAKSRQENLGQQDEREAMIISDASRVGMTVGGVLSVIMVMISKLFSAPMLGLSAWSVYFAMYGSRYAYQYAKTKENSCLIKAIIGLVAAVVFFVSLIVLMRQK